MENNVETQVRLPFTPRTSPFLKHSRSSGSLASTPARLGGIILRAAAHALLSTPLLQQPVLFRLLLWQALRLICILPSQSALRLARTHPAAARAAGCSSGSGTKHPSATGAATYVCTSLQPAEPSTQPALQTACTMRARRWSNPGNASKISGCAS